MEDYHAELLGRWSHYPSTECIMEYFMELSSLVQNSDKSVDPRKFVSSPVFPILMSTGEIKIIKYVSGESDFYIADDVHFFKSFRGKVNMLAFYPHQVQHLKPLSAWLDLEHRYLSHCGRYTCDWDQQEQPIECDWNISPEAILRVAAYFDSPRAKTNEARMKLLKTIREAAILKHSSLFSLHKLAKPQRPSLVS
ncbi:ATPase-like, ATP-binding domain [Fusarium austroafricanum]|uniref:ATPase-like, ATP-binding domain n=1 Tax=Fusarium austroafricanum TaxID=2364996 RepID=A0A8H4KHD4_9HYPO|nr:ATPase-like, ATP-binding domain [Fusarium austroafricanum]